MLSFGQKKRDKDNTLEFESQWQTFLITLGPISPDEAHLFISSALSFSLFPPFSKVNSSSSCPSKRQNW